MSHFKALRCFICVLPIFLLLAKPLSADIVIPDGITGAWFNPERDGEGFFIEIADVDGNRVFVVTWYTYEHGEQRWLLGSAPLNSNETRIQVPMRVTHGADFGEAFNPNDVVSTDWGTLEFSFTSCDSGTVHYQSESGSGSIALTRLILIKGLGCEVPGSSPDSPGGAVGTTHDGIVIDSENIIQAEWGCGLQLQVRNTTSEAKWASFTYSAFDASGVHIANAVAINPLIPANSTSTMEGIWSIVTVLNNCDEISRIELTDSTIFSP
jgi:hypothetical protein